MQENRNITGTVKTATGKEFPCESFGIMEHRGRLNIRISETPLEKVAEVFKDPKETVQLWSGEEYVAHYTRLDRIVLEPNSVRVVLMKE